MHVDLISYLRAHSDLIAALGTINGRAAIDWNTRPDVEKLPALTLQTVSPGQGYDQDTADALTSPRVQVDIWAATYGEARAVSIALNAALHALKKTAQGGTEFIRARKDSERDLGAVDQPGGARVHHISADWIIQSQPT